MTGLQDISFLCAFYIESSFFPNNFTFNLIRVKNTYELKNLNQGKHLTGLNLCSERTHLFEFQPSVFQFRVMTERVVQRG